MVHFTILLVGMGKEGKKQNERNWNPFMLFQVRNTELAVQTIFNIEDNKIR